MTRWRIEGTLTVREGSALHIGSGETSKDRGVYQNLPGGLQGDAVEVNTVITDHLWRPYVPGSSLKGALRSRALSHGADPGSVDLAFGTASHRGATAFLDSFLADDAGLPAAANAPPYWDRSRMTGVATGVTIDRRTRAAEESKLFHSEFVPPGVTFGVALEVDGAEAEPAVGVLLSAFDGFGDAADPLTLGASTGNGWGRLEWKRTGVFVRDQQEVLAWLERLQKGPHGAPAWRRVTVAPALAHPAKAAVTPVLRCEIQLAFEGPFLVNDPSRTGKKSDPSPKQPAHVPLRDDTGKASLPASSFRGAVRSQAERILRTVAGPGAACPKPSGRRCVSRRTPTGNVEGLCPACILFGASGWRSPLNISPFRQAEAAQEATQDFLAIDNFTGGAARHLKFDAQASQGPVLQGVIELDLSRLAVGGGASWTLGLLALLARDLVDGEITFGFGAAKGYGWCRATMVRVSWPERLVLPAPLAQDGSLPDWAPGAEPNLGREEWKKAIDAWVRAIGSLRTLEGAK